MLQMEAFFERRSMSAVDVGVCSSAIFPSREGGIYDYDAGMIWVF